MENYVYMLHYIHSGPLTENIKLTNLKFEPVGLQIKVKCFVKIILIITFIPGVTIRRVYQENTIVVCDEVS